MAGLTDVTLVLKDKKKIRANRNVLSEASPFFSALLNSDMRESEEEIIRLEHFTDTAIKDVLQFTRYGNIEITQTNVQDLIVAADYLLLPNLKTIAGRFLKDNITTSNCILIYYFADKYRCEEHVVRKAREFILSRFSIVAKSEDFLNLEYQKVEEWISSDEIAIGSEEEIIKIILKWAEHKKNERKGKLQELFRHVRFAFVSRDYLTDVVTNHLVTENSSCLKLVRDAMKGVQPATDNDIPPPGRNWQHNHLVVLAGNQASCYDPDEKMWYQMGNALQVYKQYDLLSFQGNLHVFPRYKDFCQTERYDTLCDRWVSLGLAPSHFAGHFLRYTAVLGTGIYSINYTQKRSHRAERFIMKYNVKSDSWRQVSSPQYHEPWQSGEGSCVVAMDNYLYVIGGMLYVGRNLKGEHLLTLSAHAMRFNTNNWKWDRIASMKYARHSACGVAARGRIFVAGGVIYSGLNKECVLVTKECEMYNVSTNEWQFIASLQKPRWGGSMVYLKGSLYVVGGKRYNKEYRHTLVVESYDFESNAWKPETKIPLLPHDAIPKRNNIKACTLTVGNQVLTRPITRFQLFKGWLLPSTG